MNVTVFKSEWRESALSSHFGSHVGFDGVYFLKIVFCLLCVLYNQNIVCWRKIKLSLQADCCCNTCNTLGKKGI